MSTDGNRLTGVIGVGSMGRNHARVYSELQGVELVGVADADRQQAHVVAEKYDTESLPVETLIDRADAVSVAVPTEFHYEVAKDCLAAGVDVLVEKPFVAKLEQGRELARLADAAGAVLQVGHIERFNPAVRAVLDLVSDLDLIAVDFRRLGPPLNRDIEDSVVLDLMIHDIDIALDLISSDVRDLSASSTRDGQYATARIDFANGVIGTLTASRRTQRKVRTLEVTAETCQLTVDYLDQSVKIHRRSRPEYTDVGSEMRFRRESVIERPMIDTGEPLRHELESFIDASVEGHEPAVPAEDGLRAMRLARRLDELATSAEEPAPVPVE